MSTEQKWWIECGANLPKGGFTRNHIMPVNKVVSFRMKWDNKGVFSTAYMYDNEEQKDANLYGDFYLDFDRDIADSEDKEEVFNILREEVIKTIRYLKVIYSLEVNQIKIYFSGSKGVHLVVPKEILGIIPCKYLNIIYRMMAEDIRKFTQSTTLDLKIYDRVRLFRLPNSIHQKTGLYKIPLTYNELSKLKYEQLRELASSPRPEEKIELILSTKANMEYRNYIKKADTMINKPRGKSPDVKLEYTPPCVDVLLNNPVSQGQRNDTLAFLASFFRQSGYTEENAMNILLKWADSMCSPSIPEHEVYLTINSIYKGNGKMGCSKAKIISKCDPDKCKLHKKGF